MKEKARGTITNMENEDNNLTPKLASKEEQKTLYKKQHLSCILNLVASSLFLVGGILFFCIKTSSYRWLYIVCGIILCISALIYLVLAILGYSKLKEIKDGISSMEGEGKEK